MRQTRGNTCFVGLAGDQFCRNLGEKAFSYCGEKGESPRGLSGLSPGSEGSVIWV